MEIERKFLIKTIPSYIKDNLHLLEPKSVIQYYIGFEPEIRIRNSNGKLTFTLKNGEGLIRQEVEFEIDKVVFENIVNMGKFPYVEKTRYNIPLDGRIIELDIYKDLDELMTAEIEFETIDEANRFSPPTWFDIELTGKKEFSNGKLALNGRPEWNSCKLPATLKG